MRFEPALRIALIYAGFSLFYIFVSDVLVEHLVADTGARMVQTAKGTIFVLFSALVIYFLIRAELKKRARLREVALRAQRLEAIGQFATAMAHDFNNILTVVIGGLDMSEDILPPDHPAHVHLANSRNAAEKAGELTHRMLIFSRQSHLTPRPVDVNQSAKELIPLLNLATGEKVSVRCKLSDELPPVIAEPSKLQNILLNLIVNSRDAMPSGGDIFLETDRERVESQLSNGPWTVPPGDYVTVLVRDTGEGMSKKIMEKVSEPFFTTKPMGKGTGLGLTTVRDSMRAWQGHLMITSSSGLGTTVKMYLPATGQEPPPQGEIAWHDSRQ
jgi:signal transduction histidine kinase